MSSDPRKPDDRDLDAFLRNEDATSRAYAETRDLQPPADLDSAVLNFARTTARTTRSRSRLRRWQRPLALAAVLTLSMGVLLQLWKEPQVRNPIAAREETARTSDATPPAAQTEPSASAMSAPEQEPASKGAAEPRIEITARKPIARTEKPRAPAPAAPSPPPPPPAMAAAEAPTIATESVPLVTSTPTATFAPPAPQPDSRPMPAPTMGARAADAMADHAAGLTEREDAAQERSRAAESVQRSFAQRKESPRAASAAPYAEPKKLEEKTSSWPAPRFGTLQLGSATRAEVLSRYGEPSSQGLSSPDDKNPDRRELLYDFYERLPSQTGAFEFYYERPSLRLLSVRRVFKPAVKAQALVAELGWTEAPILRDWQHPPCLSDSTAASVHASQPPLYWLYPARGAYLFLPTAGSVEQVVFEARCDPVSDP